MKILVLGSNGFIGKSVMAELRKKNHQVVGIGGKNTLDLRDYGALTSRLKKEKPSVVINCASHGGSLHYVTEFAADIIDDNVRIFLNVYRAVKEVCPKARIINPISNCSYPGAANIQKEHQFWDGPVHQSVWSFGNSRRILLAISHCYKIQYGIATTNFLVPNAYGPGDHLDPNKTHALGGMIIRMIKAQKANEPSFEIWGTGKPRREWVYVKDVARILASTATDLKKQPELVNIAQNMAYPIRKTAQIIKRELQYGGALVFNASYQDGAPIKKMDDRRFRSLYPKFSFTDINEGIRETIKYYQQII